jgi:hypothetical protein
MALPNGGSAYQVSDGNVEANKLIGGPALVATSGAGIYFLTTAITANVTTTTVRFWLYWRDHKRNRRGQDVHLRWR